MTKGSLIIVGSGIKAVSHVTQETIFAIENADIVLYLVADPVSELWIKKLNSNAESLSSYYQEDKTRSQSYQNMVEKILEYVRENHNVCVIFYGHPGIFVNPSHKAILQARSEGYNATMLPAISAEDCLFADIGIDPCGFGYQSYEATDFLIYRRKFDPSCSLILWQIGVISEIGFNKKQMCNINGIRELIKYLSEFYDLNHELIVYEAAVYCHCNPFIQHVNLGNLDSAHISPISTLYIPPKKSIPNNEMLAHLYPKHSP